MTNGRSRSPRGMLQAVERRARRLLSARDPGHTDEGGFSIVLDYPVDPVPRFGYGKPPHPQLYALFDRRRKQFAETLETFLDHRERLQAIPFDAPDPFEPYWCNGYFQGLDAVALYCLIASNQPRRYVEVGSGHSTKFARRAARDHDLALHITSIDPDPRAAIDELSDAVIRRPLEDVGLAIVDDLRSGDIFFVDGSHRVFTNSDATVALTELLPRLAPGVLVHIHDVFLPWDYPPQMADRYYSEQYLVACHLLSGPGLVEIVLPNFFICTEKELHDVLGPLWSTMTWAAIPTNGTSMWLRRTGGSS